MLKANTFSWNSEYPDDEYRHLYLGTTFAPIFILGLHRSGTSLLYNMLAATGVFNFLSFYHIANFESLVCHHRLGSENDKKAMLQSVLDESGVVDREIDRLQVSPDFAEEYSFILGQRYYPQRTTPGNLGVLVEMCRKVQYISENDRPLLLKNPYDFSNFIFLKRCLPNAKFVFIHRHPLYVMTSGWLASKVLFDKYRPYTAMLSLRYSRIAGNRLLFGLTRLLYSYKWSPGILRAAQSYARGIRYYMKNFHRLPETDYISIRYEDLCEDTDGTMKSVLDFLGLSRSGSFKDSIEKRDTVAPGRVRIVEQYLRTYLGDYYRLFNYR